MNKTLLFFCLAICTSAVSQKKILFTNSEKIDNKRYGDVKGNPFVFEDWVLGTIIDEDDVEYKDVYLNYNSHLEAFEVKKNDSSYIVLNPLTYKKVIIKDAKAKEELELEFLDELVFKKVVHPKMKGLYVLSIFEGKGYQLLKYFKSTIVTTKKNIPGEIVKINRFNSKDIMILFDHGAKIEFGMKKRSMKNNLPLYFNLDKWNKKNKINVYSYEGLISRIKELIENGS